MISTHTYATRPPHAARRNVYLHAGNVKAAFDGSSWWPQRRALCSRACRLRACAGIIPLHACRATSGRLICTALVLQAANLSPLERACGAPILNLGGSPCQHRIASSVDAVLAPICFQEPLTKPCRLATGRIYPASSSPIPPSGGGS